MAELRGVLRCDCVPGAWVGQRQRGGAWFGMHEVGSGWGGVGLLQPLAELPRVLGAAGAGWVGRCGRLL